MIAVFDRSRPGMNVAAALRPTSNAPSDSASPANAARTRSVRLAALCAHELRSPRWATRRRSPSACGRSRPGRCRARSPTRASDEVPLVGAARSELGEEAVEVLGEGRCVAVRGRAQPRVEAGRPAVEQRRSARPMPRTARDMSPHREGGSRRVDAPEPGHQSHGPCGSPIAVQTCARMPGPIDAPIDWLMCWWNIRRYSGRSETIVPSSAASDSSL